MAEEKRILKQEMLVIVEVFCPIADRLGFRAKCSQKVFYGQCDSFPCPQARRYEHNMKKSKGFSGS